MAAAFPSPLAASTETTNGVKLRRLLVDGGTTALRKVFDDKHPPTDLAANLHLNNSTLDDLFARGILTEQQRNLLFPTNGSKPDSKTFDITLLFLLLTEISGLSPPARTGWNHKPQAKNKSLAANLVRIKLFRNKLIHTPETRIDSRLFNELWKEMSGVLVSLGLEQAEINRLKTERCGEEDYLKVLFQWVDREKEINARLKEVSQSQTTMLKAVETVGQTQQEHLTLLQDANAKLEQTCKTQQGTKSKLDTIHQGQANTQEILESVQQTQLEDHETLQDNKSKLNEVYQTQTKTHETVEKVRQIQLEDHQTLQDSKSKMDKVHQIQTKTQATVEKVRETQLKDSETLFKSVEEVKEAVDTLKQGRDQDRSEEVLSNLAKSEFKGDIEYFVGRYQEGTREWVFDEVLNWLDDRNSQNRLMVISSNAGMGKSVIAAVTCIRMQEAGRLSGSHFCQHNNARYRKPQLMLQSLACHLSHALPEYKQALVKQLSRNLGIDLNNMGVEELFALLFKEPLSTVADPGRNMLMVIDGLDESENQERNELLDVLAKHLSKLPCWIRFLCTTRPERNIAEALKDLKPFQLEQNDDKNMEDIKRFIENKTQHLIKPEKQAAILEKLVEKSEGLMLHAYFLVLFIEENKSVLDEEDLDDSLALAISSVYRSYFKRLENELKKEVGVNEEHFLNLLSALIASREPMPIDFVSKLLGLNCSSPLARRKVRKAISSVSSLFPIRDDCLHVIHKSVKDWLTDASCYGEHDFTMDEREGHHILASVCAGELDHLKQKGVREAQLSPSEKYALYHGVQHMLQLDENVRTPSVDKCVQTYVTDLELLYVKLRENNSTAAEDILWLQSQELSRSLCAESKDLLNILMVLLRKHFSTFKDHPQLFFQTVLNERGPVLSSMASNMLQNKYPEIPYMEFVNKQMQQETRFRCSSEVVCFDVSPQLDYMVCECWYGIIQLWLIRTGEPLWTPGKKKYTSTADFVGRFPSSGVLSFYRSTVFHPTKDVVLPGVLSYAYDFHGNLKPLFPESKCSFTVCSISGDKTKILTNCPHNHKCIIMWSLKNGSEITRTTRDEDVLSFACTRDGKLLAISHLSGRIAIVDVVNSFTTLGQTNLQSVCGVIRFSPDSRSLLCCHFALYGFDHEWSTFRLNINISEQFSLRVDVVEEPYATWEFESRTEGGFLLGDLLPCVSEKGDREHVKCEFVLDEHTVLRSDGDGVDMLNINEQQQNEKEAAHTTVKEIAFSLSGEAIYAISRHGDLPTTVTAWNVSSGERIAEKEVDVLSSSRNYLAVVKGGVLIITGMCPLQMWNFELSECIWCWTNIGSVTEFFPVSEERVACTTEERKVVILDSTSREILSTIQIGRNTNLLACNSKFQILTRSEDGSLRLSDRKTTLWEKKLRSRRCVFSPTETFVISIISHFIDTAIYVLDAFSGETLHVLVIGDVSKCEFVSDEECVVICRDSNLRVVQLFNVKSGDLLSNLPPSKLLWDTCLVASPCKSLVAISSSDSEHGYELIQVRLPGNEESRKSKWTLNPEEHRKVQEGEQEECSCVSKYNRRVDVIEAIFRGERRLPQPLRGMLGIDDDDDNDDDYTSDACFEGVQLSE